MTTYTYTCSLFSAVVSAATPSDAASQLNHELSRQRIGIRVTASDFTLFRHTPVRIFKHN